MSDKDQLVAASIKVSLLEATRQKFDTPEPPTRINADLISSQLRFSICRILSLPRTKAHPSKGRGGGSCHQSPPSLCLRLELIPTP